MPVSRSTVRPERRVGPKERRQHSEFSVNPIQRARTGIKQFARALPPDGVPSSIIELDKRNGPADRRKNKKE